MKCVKPLSSLKAKLTHALTAILPYATNQQAKGEGKNEHNKWS